MHDITYLLCITLYGIVEPMHSLPNLFLIPAQHTSQDIHTGPSVKESIFPPSSFHLWSNIQKNNPKNGFLNIPFSIFSVEPPSLSRFRVLVSELNHLSMSPV